LDAMVRPICAAEIPARRSSRRIQTRGERGRGEQGGDHAAPPFLTERTSEQHYPTSQAKLRLPKADALAVVYADPLSPKWCTTGAEAGHPDCRTIYIERH
jgi:hypothetical protein